MEKEMLIRQALGREKPDLVLKDANVVNVFTGEILMTDVAICGDKVAGLGSYDGKENISLKGKYLTPGFINTHCHVESAMVMPEVYCQEELKWGTTTIITDPHEIANVAGLKGILFMLRAASLAPVNYYVQMPSCVPATPFEQSGAVLSAEDLVKYAGDSHVLGLGEMMNFPGVLNGDAEVMKKLRAFEGRILDGHAPGMSGRELEAYAAAGIGTDHESVTFEEAREKLRAGIAVLVREGSASKNLKSILTGVLKEGLDTGNMAFCTDDKHLSDIRKEGTIRCNIKAAVELGMNPVQAIQMATINGARIFGLKNTGAVAPGYKADLVVLDSLSEMNVMAVYKDGRPVQSSNNENGEDQLILPLDFQELSDSVHIPQLTQACFHIPEHEYYSVVQIVPGEIITKKHVMTKDELDQERARKHVLKMAVIERHHATGAIGTGWLEGYGLSRGAAATTVAHDSHNMIVVGDNDEDMIIAAKELERVHGGYTLVRDKKVVGTLPLPVCGLLSLLPPDRFVDELDELLRMAAEMGVDGRIDPFITLSFMALPVIPEIRITDKGVFDVVSFSFLDS